MSTPPPPPSDGPPSDGTPSDGIPSNGDSDKPYGYDPDAPGTSGASAGFGTSGYQAAPRYYGGAAPNDVDNNFGIIALVTGLLGVLICQPVGIAAIIYGRRAQEAEAAGRANNGTLGVVGFWLGVVALILLAIALVFVVLIVVGIASVGFFSFN